MNTGTDSEKEFERILKKHYGRKVFIHRITDSKEVRGRSKAKHAFTKAQPSDYIVTENGQMYYAEVKSCSNKTSFPFSQISEHQMASAIQQNYAKGNYWFYIHNIITNVWYKIPALAFNEHDRKSFKWDEINNFKWELQYE